MSIDKYIASCRRGEHPTLDEAEPEGDGERRCVECGRGETETLDKMEQRVKFDIDYLRRWSLWLDLKICFLTAWQLVFKRDNVY